MASCVSKAMLNRAIDRINRLMGTPLTPFDEDAPGRPFNVGHYMLEHANSGYRLVQIVNENGAERNVTEDRCSKRELLTRIEAYRRGIEDYHAQLEAPAMKLRTQRMKWQDWMSQVAWLLHRGHKISPADIRPTAAWTQMWRANYDPTTAAGILAQRLER
jgi:hypothetical protein